MGTVAIGIVAETCGPFAVLPALMFEYIGEMGKDYVYSVAPLLDDALIDRDIVHRQTGISAVKHLTLGVQGLNCEDAIDHLMNYVWPNIFETTPHLVQYIVDCIDAFRVTLGPTKVLQYILQGLWHPARRVREVYWKLFNNLYIGAQDALVPVYPKLEDDDEEHCYRRTELELLL